MTDEGVREILRQARELEDELREHRRHTIDTAPISDLPILLREIKSMERQTAAIVERCGEGRPVVVRPTPPV